MSLGGDAVPVAVRDAFDESVVPQSAQVVGPLSAAECSWDSSEERLEVFAEVGVGEAAGQ
jgi:hypothetical protein